MARVKGTAPEQAAAASLGTFGRYAGPATLILSSLAQGPKHGYALKRTSRVAGIRLAPGTLYEALSRLEGQHLIEAIPSDDRRKPYKLTTAGAAALRTHLNTNEKSPRLAWSGWPATGAPRERHRFRGNTGSAHDALVSRSVAPALRGRVLRTAGR